MFRATQKIKTWLFACLMAVVTALVAVSACLLPTSTVANAADESATWTLVTDASTLLADDKIIIAAKDSAVAMSTTQGNNNRGQASITKSDNTATFGDDVQQLTLEKGKTSGTFAFNTGDGYLYAASSKKNYLRTETTLSDNSSWTITIAADGTATVKAQGTNTRNTMQYNQDSSLFACYGSASQKAIVFYKAITASEPDCDHVEKYVPNAGEGTHNIKCSKCDYPLESDVPCTEKLSYEKGAGTHTVIGTCTLCDGNTKTQENVACEYNTVVTKPTKEKGGYTTYTCKYCEYSYYDDFTPALGQTEATVTYHVPAGVAAINPVTVDINSTVELPTLENPVGYVFEGWTISEYNTAVENEPEILTGEYEVAADVELYALYSQTVKGDDAWTLVKNTSALAVGDKIVIAATGYEVALSTTQNKNNRGKATITKSGENITFGSDVQMITLANGNINDTWAFNVGNGYLYAAGGSSENYLRTDTTLNDAASFTVEIADDGNATVKANINGRNWLRYNSSSNGGIFSCYGSGQTDICLYKFVSGTKTVYQTLKKLADIDSATLTVKDDLTVNYYVSLNDYYVGAQMKFTMLGEETVVNGVFQEEDGRYKYSFTDIAPQYMGENIKAELVFNGKVLTTLEKYSVQQYVKNTINSENQTLKRLLSDLLYYGDAAQKFVGYNEENLVSTGVDGLLDQVTANPTTVKDLITEPADSYPIYFKSAGMLFDNVNKLYVRLEGALEGATLSVAKDGVKVNDYALTSNVFYTDGIVATDFNAVYTFELYVNNTKLQTLTYSVNSYAYAMQGDAEMGELAAALYNYGAAAEAYKA